jgi:hypothetical protein
MWELCRWLCETLISGTGGGGLDGGCDDLHTQYAHGGEAYYLHRHVGTPLMTIGRKYCNDEAYILPSCSFGKDVRLVSIAV